MNKGTHAVQLLAILRLRLVLNARISGRIVPIKPKINILNLKPWLRRIDQSWLTLRCQIGSQIIVVVVHNYMLDSSLSIVGTWHVCLTTVDQEWIVSRYFNSTSFLNTWLYLKWVMNHVGIIIIKRWCHIDLSSLTFVSIWIYNHWFSERL